MTPRQLIDILETYNPGRVFCTELMFNENTIDYDWNSDNNTTAQEAITALYTMDLDEPMTIDIEDGFIYREVTGVRETYWSASLDILDFLSD